MPLWNPYRRLPVKSTQNGHEVLWQLHCFCGGSDSGNGRLGTHVHAGSGMYSGQVDEPEGIRLTQGY